MGFKLYSRNFSNNWEEDNFIRTPGGDNRLPQIDDDVFTGASESSSGKSITGGLNQSNIRLNSFTQTKLFAAQIGTSSTSLQIDISEARFFGQGNVYWEANNTYAVPKVLIHTANPSALIAIDSDSSATEGFVEIVLSQGNLNCGANFMWSAGGLLQVSGNSTATLESGGTPLPSLMAFGGTILCSAGLTQGHIAGSTVLTIDTNALTGDLVIGPGARCILNDEAQAGDGAVIFVHPGGILDLTQNSFAKTIDELHLMPGSILHDNPNLHTYVTLYDDRQTL